MASYRVEEQNRALVSAIGRPRFVLDVGCGSGLNGAAAKRRGAHVTGVEIEPAAAAQARTRLDTVHTGDLFTAPLESYDLILLADVLEHLVDPAAALRHLLPHLDDGGHVIASLPNVAAWTNRLSLLAGRWDYQPSGILDETHLRFFTLRSAVRLLEEAGLEVLHTAQNPMLMRAAKRLINGAALDGDKPLRKTLPYKLYQAFVRPAEDVVASRAPELLAFQHVLVARKPPSPGALTLTVGMLTMDEEQSAARMIAAIREQAPDADILVVDSSRHDRTPQICRDLGARVLRQIPARGHGPAMELLMYSAAGEMLVYLDCDFTYPPAYIPTLRRLIERDGYDVVNAARTRHKPSAMPWPNYLANRSFAAMAHAMHGVPTVDVHSGMRAYRTSVIRAFDFDGEGDAIPIDTLLYPAKHGYRVAEIDIDYDERVGTSKLRKISGALWTAIRLGRAIGVGGKPRRYTRL